jgi:hypothetical protein
MAAQGQAMASQNDELVKCAYTQREAFANTPA